VQLAQVQAAARLPLADCRLLAPAKVGAGGAAVLHRYGVCCHPAPLSAAILRRHVLVLPCKGIHDAKQSTPG
jgi:hypothetical protein